MNDCPTRTTASSRIISGALAYLSMHLDSACPRSAYLAALLLGRIADDPENDAELRAQARSLLRAGDRGGIERWMRANAP